MASKIKKGDQVIVIAGRDKGKKGKILKVYPKESRVIVQGVHMVKRHKKPTMETPGSIQEKEATIHVSNVAMIAKDGKSTRVGFATVDGKKVRVEKRTGEVIKG